MGRSIATLGLGALLLAAGAVVSCDRHPGGAASTLKVRRIAVVAPAPTANFWRAVQAGAATTARDAHDVLVSYRGPGVDRDAALQAVLIQEMVSAKPDALVLGPAAESVPGPPLEEARRANIPVVIVDRDYAAQPGDGIAAVVTVNNRRAGALAAARLGEVLKHGRVVLFRDSKSDPNSALREEGFVSEMARYPALTLIDPGRYSGPTIAEAKTAADLLITEQPEAAAVFCPSEISAHGMVLALRERNLNGKVKVVGFESSFFLVHALAMDDVDSLVVTDAVMLGKLGVRAALDALEGKPVQAHQEVGVELATRANMHDEPMKFLLLPDLPPEPGTP